MYGLNYMMIEWDNADVDEPFRVYMELDDKNVLLRKIEVYRAGLQEVYRNLNTPVNLTELAGEDGEKQTAGCGGCPMKDKCSKTECASKEVADNGNA